MTEMRISWGSTRWVILAGPYAIKVARFRPLRAAIRMIQLFSAGERFERLNHYDTRFIPAVLKYFGAGVLANQAEYERYKVYENLRLVPSLKCFFGGFVLIQARGEPLQAERHTDVFRHPLWCEMLLEGMTKKAAMAQFCVYRGRVHLADYGRSDIVFPAS